MYDLIIIGGGPAGSAAAVYAARKQLKTLMIVAEFGGQSSVSPEIYNWIGTNAISGLDLAKSFKSHAKEYEGEYLEIVEGQYVTAVKKDGDDFTVTTKSEDSFTARTVLVTTGSVRRKLYVPGAEQFENRGVVYCASCDGPLFTGQDVAVIGGGNAGFESAAQLAAYCSSVTIIHRSDEFRADATTVEKVLSRDNVTALKNTIPTAILGDKLVTGLTYTNRETNEVGELPVTGVFVEIGQLPNTDMVASVVERDEYNRITIDPWTQRTSTAGIWAAGDCTNVRFHQNNISAGDAVKALEDIYLFLHAGK